MKKFLILLFICNVFSVSGQQNKKQTRNGANRLENLKKELQLSDSQVTSIKAINLETRKEMKTIRDKFRDNEQELKIVQRKVRRAHREKILSVLTDEQRLRLKELKKERKKKSNQPNEEIIDKGEQIEGLLKEN